MAFTLPELPYPYDALAPYMGEETLQLHHDKHHQTYVTNLNNLIAGTDLENKTLEEIVVASAKDPAKAGIFNNAGQHWNHNLFWRTMKKGGGGKPGGELAKRIDHDFGSYEKFAEQFKQAGVTRLVLVSVFGAGDTAEKASGLAKLVYRTALGKFLHDKAAADKILQASGLEWTIVYPVNLRDTTALTEKAAVKRLDQVGKVPGLPTLPMDNAAEALLDVVTDPKTAGQRLLITTPTGWMPATGGGR